MDYFKKVGRPTDEEQAVINAIEEIITGKQIPRSEIPHCQTLDDLLEVLNLTEAYVADNETESDEKESVGTEETAIAEGIEESDSDRTDTEPLRDNQDNEISEPLEQQTTSELNADELDTQTEDVENETLQPNKEPEAEPITVDDDLPNFVSDDYDPFSAEIKERSYTSQMDSEQKPKPLAENSHGGEDLNLEESAETPVDNLNPNTKRKVAEQTANSILKGYAKLAPQPFKWFAKVDENKIEKLAFEGEININLEVSEGTTFDDYMRQTNEQVDEIFEVDEDTLDEIREPLIEVLLEQKLELTPQQRLMMAVISHLFQMFTVALNLRRQNNRILEYQKRMTLMTAQKAA